MPKQQSITRLSAKAGRSLLMLDQFVTFKVTGPQTGGEYQKPQLEFVAPVEAAPAR
jgi:hypothetical protein